MFFHPKFDVEAKEAWHAIQSESVFLLDCREVYEYEEGHIPHAHLIPIQEIETRQHEIPKHEKIYVYCRSGQRANTAKRKLLALGYTEVFNIGGVVQWPYDLVK